MPQFNIHFKRKDLREFERAVNLWPRKVKKRMSRFFVQAMREYNKVIQRNPWEIGGTRGGVPVDTGNLRDTHRREIRPWEARIYPTARYDEYVHRGTNNMEARPWLNYAFDEATPRVKQRARKVLKDIVNYLGE